jgi:hypothetical protein
MKMDDPFKQRAQHNDECSVVNNLMGQTSRVASWRRVSSSRLAGGCRRSDGGMDALDFVETMFRSGVRPSHVPTRL